MCYDATFLQRKLAVIPPLWRLLMGNRISWPLVQISKMGHAILGLGNPKRHLPMAFPCSFRIACILRGFNPHASHVFTLSSQSCHFTMASDTREALIHLSLGSLNHRATFLPKEGKSKQSHSSKRLKYLCLQNIREATVRISSMLTGDFHILC